MNKSQRKIYQEAKEQAYLIKEKLSKANKEELNSLLTNLVKSVPEETKETITIYIRATLLLGWESTKTQFDLFWKYITLAKLKESTNSHYKDTTKLHLDSQVESTKKEIQTIIKELVGNYVESKHSQDELYQRWVKK